MAHHKSAKKRIRQTVRRTAINRARTSRVRTFLKKVEDAIATGNKDAARAAFVEAQPEMHRGVVKGILHRNTVKQRTRPIAQIVKHTHLTLPQEPARRPSST